MSSSQNRTWHLNRPGQPPTATLTASGMAVEASESTTTIELTWWRSLLAPRTDRRKQPVPHHITLPTTALQLVAPVDFRVPTKWRRGRLVFRPAGYPCPWKLGWISGRPSPRYVLRFGRRKMPRVASVLAAIELAAVAGAPAGPAPRQRRRAPRNAPPVAARRGTVARQLSNDRGATAGRVRRTG